MAASYHLLSLQSLTASRRDEQRKAVGCQHDNSVGAERSERSVSGVDRAHHGANSLRVAVGAGGKRLNHATLVVGRAILTHLELALQSRDGDLKRNDGGDLLAQVVLGEI